MSNQTNKPTPITILILPKYLQYFDNQLAENIIATWKKDGKIIKVIPFKNAWDNEAFEQLITEVKLSDNQPITVMFDEELSDTPYHALLWAVLGTLIIMGLITITTYEQKYKKIIFHSITGSANQYLLLATYFFKNYCTFSNNKIAKVFSNSGTSNDKSD